MPENVAEARQWLTVAIDDEVKRLTMIRRTASSSPTLTGPKLPPGWRSRPAPKETACAGMTCRATVCLIRAIGKFVEVRNASIAGTFNLLDYDLDELKECDHPSDPNAGTHADPIGDSSESGDGQAEVAGPANDEAVRAGVDNETAGDWIWDQVAKLAPIRAEDLRKLNEECRNEGQDIKAAARRSRRVANKNGTRASDQVQSEEPPTMVAGVCDPGVPTTPANVAAVCDPDLPERPASQRPATMRGRSPRRLKNPRATRKRAISRYASEARNRLLQVLHLIAVVTMIKFCETNPLSSSLFRQWAKRAITRVLR